MNDKEKLAAELLAEFNKLTNNGKMKVVEVVKGKYPAVSNALRWIAENQKALPMRQH